MMTSSVALTEENPGKGSEVFRCTFILVAVPCVVSRCRVFV